MPHRNPRRRARQVAALRQRCVRSPGLPFAAVLPQEQAEAALAAEGVTFRRRLFTPVVTLYAFLGQVLDPDHSCRAAVARVVAWLVGLGRAPCSADTGGYCKARKRLPEGALARLTRDTGHDLERQHGRPWRWHGHTVKVVDGSTVSGPDTPANQRAYPQPKTQKPGLGFPLLRLVVLFSLSVGTVLDAAFCPYQGKETGETALWRALRHHLQPGDILLADRYHCSYWEMVDAQRRGTHVVARLHQRRTADFRRGRRLGPDDHLVTWRRHRSRPPWMDRATYAAMPRELTVREVRIRIPKGRCRTREVVVATTLLDPARYPKGEIAALYRRRWEVEVDLRSLKQTLQMDILRCRTPELLRKELWAHFLVYNLLRAVQAQAAAAHHCRPGHLSFKGTLQTVNAFAPLLADALPERRAEAYGRLLEAVAAHRVGDRPDRCEPRAVKRRPKAYPQLTRPRPQARARLVRGR